VRAKSFGMGVSAKQFELLASHQVWPFEIPLLFESSDSVKERFLFFLFCIPRSLQSTIPIPSMQTS
jgi:hypothetical protein